MGGGALYQRATHPFSLVFYWYIVLIVFFSYTSISILPSKFIKSALYSILGTLPSQSCNAESIKLYKVSIKKVLVSCNAEGARAYFNSIQNGFQKCGAAQVRHPLLPSRFQRVLRRQ